MMWKCFILTEITGRVIHRSFSVTETPELNLMQQEVNVSY